MDNIYSAKDYKKIEKERLDALRSWVNTIQKAVCFGVSFRRRLVGIVSFAKQGKLNVSFYIRTTDQAREEIKRVVRARTGDILDSEPKAGDQHYFISSRCLR